MRSALSIMTATLLGVILQDICAAQNARVSWDSFTMGFGRSQADNILVKSAIGQNFAGVTRQANTQIIGGFLSNALANGMVVAVEEEQELPTSYALEQNYPNPFNPTTVVSCQWPVASRVRLVVYDLLGREVAVLMDELKDAGRFTITFDACGLASGVYFCRMVAEDPSGKSGQTFVETRKMMVLR